MSTVRTHKKRGFTTIDNNLLCDDRLTFEARGVLAYLLSKPDGWQVKTTDLIDASPAGKDKIYRILAEIESAGYLIRWISRTAGRINWHSEIFESIDDRDRWIADNPNAEIHNAREGETIPGKPGVGKAGHLINTDLSNTELENTDLKDLDQKIDFSENSHFDEPIDGELIDANASTEQCSLVNREGFEVRIESSGGAARVSMADFLGDCLAIYSRDRPGLWADIRALTPQREKGFKQLLKVFDGDRGATIQALCDALAFCRQDSWWGATKLGLDTLLAKGRVVEFAEKWQVLQLNPIARELSTPEQAREAHQKAQLLQKIKAIQERNNAE